MSIYYAKGRYVCRGVSQALGQSGTGKPQFALQFTVLGTPDPDDPEKYIPVEHQYERTYYKSITEGTVTYFVEDLKALGFTGGSFRLLDPKTPGFHNFKDEMFDMYCNHKPAQGQYKEKEEWFPARLAGGGEIKVKPLDSASARELDNLFGKHLKALGGTQKAAPAPAQTQADSSDDGDCPF